MQQSFQFRIPASAKMKKLSFLDTIRMKYRRKNPGGICSNHLFALGCFAPICSNIIEGRFFPTCLVGFFFEIGT